MTWRRPVLLLQSLVVHVSFDHADLGDLDFFVSSIPSGPYTLTASSYIGFSESRGEGFDKDITFKAECSKVSHSLNNI